MARIPLSEGFKLIPEGTHVFKITNVNYKEDFGKMEITMETESGQKHVERFSLLKSNGDPNDGALNAFSFFAKTALNDFDLDEIDEQDLVGHFIECDVTHEEVDNPKRPGQKSTFARLGNKRVSEGFGEKESEPTKKPRINLDDLLG